MKQALMFTTRDKYHEYAYKKIFDKVGVSYQYVWRNRSFYDENDICVETRKYTVFKTFVSKPEEIAIRKLMKSYEFPFSAEHYDFERGLFNNEC